MSGTTARRLRAQATRLEDGAISVAEAFLDHADWPRRELSRCAHADLKLKAAAVLRERAERHE